MYLFIRHTSPTTHHDLANVSNCHVLVVEIYVGSHLRICDAFFPFENANLRKKGTSRFNHNVENQSNNRNNNKIIN
jgi:hypothetical protein